ncbi:hypothetical protein [Streptosporangium lutulentum]|uniref:Zinc transporter ZupT n=1 Tax=Streptosporangium lutulentum TaxID=1461250 RepID=A0ABT9Q6C2_9ACTN|nr:hypothetical protein [Streptosporangium lutulentum]MDP9842293.1 zinc transporter ZupT [Streptosporangium lutulentum]
MLLADGTQTLGPALEGAFPGANAGAWAAVLLVSLSTLAGAWLARRNSAKVTVWLAIASAMMLITALADLLPDAWRDAEENGVPLWGVGLAIAFGFTVITYFTRRGCGHEGAGSVKGRHALGLRHRAEEAVDVALFGGMGTAAALTLHRTIEGATLALTASTVVVIALMVHSAGEGLALAALLDMAKQRLAPWLVVSCAGPAVGVLLATVAPLPGQVVPILLGVVTGVLLRAAIVGFKLAAAKQENGRLSKRHLTIAAGVAVTAGGLLVTSHGMPGQDHSRTEPSHHVADGDTPGSPTPVPPHRTPAPQARTSAQAPLTRAQLRAAVAAERMNLVGVFARTDDTTKNVQIRGILRALPGYGAAEIANLLAAGGIDAGRRVGELTERQRRYLLNAVTG